MAARIFKQYADALELAYGDAVASNVSILRKFADAQMTAVSKTWGTTGRYAKSN